MDPMMMSDDDDESTSSHHPGLPKSTLVIGGIAVALAGLATFVAVQWTGADARAAEIRTIFAEEIEPQEEALGKELGALESELETLTQQTDVLARGKFAFCNFSDEEVTLTKLAATYLDDSGQYRTFNSEEYGDNLWRIPAGERRELNFPRGEWDGSVTYYSLWVLYKGNEYPLNRTWPLTEDHCSTWTGA